MSVIKSIEENIYNIENDSQRQIKNNEIMIKRYQELIQKQKTLYSNTIYEHASEMMKSCNEVDNQIKKFLPTQYPYSNSNLEITQNQELFNPKHVVEFKKDGIAMLEQWNESRGVLPNVVKQYVIYVRICSANKNKYARRKDMSKYYYLPFWVDNYLNLYNASSGIYLMINKLPFPQYSFKIRKNDLQRQYHINEKPIQLFDKTLDNPSDHFDIIKLLKPTNYEHVYKYHNNFRIIEQFKIYPGKYQDLLITFKQRSEHDVYTETSENTLSNIITSDHDDLDKLDDGLDQQTKLTNDAMLDMIDEMNDICLKNETEINQVLDDEELIMY